MHQWLDFIDINLNDVKDQLSNLNVRKSYGADGVSPRLLQEGGKALVDSLVRLFNMSLRLCKVPLLWKQANMVPIHKKERLKPQSHWP